MRGSNVMEARHAMQTCSGDVDDALKSASLQRAEDVHLSSIDERAVSEVERVVGERAPDVAVDDRLRSQHHLDGRRRSPVVVLASADLYVARRRLRRTTQHQQADRQRRCDDG